MLTGIDPRDGSPVGDGVPEAGPHEAQAAAAAAAEAFRRRPAPGAPGAFDDADLLEAVAGELEAVTADLVDVAGRETGLAPERLRGEVARTVGQLRAFAAARRDGLLADAVIDTARPDAAPPRPDQRRVATPIGPVAVFAASNFPFAFSTAGGDTASAFAAGCPVVLKAHPGHPATSAVTGAAVSAAVERVGAPAAWFQVLHGAAADLGQALASAPDVAAVAFTGSLRAGRALFDTAARREVPIPVFAEMGSLNPVAVTPAALAARAPGIAAALAGTVLTSAGQLCTKPNLVLVVEGPGLSDLLDGLAAPLRDGGELVMLNTRLRDGFARLVGAPRAGVAGARGGARAGVRARRRLADAGAGDGAGADPARGARAARGALRPRHGRGGRAGRRRARPARRGPARLPDRHDPRAGRRDRRPARRARGDPGGTVGAAGLERRARRV